MKVCLLRLNESLVVVVIRSIGVLVSLPNSILRGVKPVDDCTAFL